MKSFVFPYSISFGKMDSVDGQVDYFLSDANAKRLIRSAEEGGRHVLLEVKGYRSPFPLFRGVYWVNILFRAYEGCQLN